MEQKEEEQAITDEGHILFDPFRRKDIYGDCGMKKLTIFQTLRLTIFAIIFIPIRVILVSILILLCYATCKIFSWIPIGNIKYLYINYICTILSKICLFIIGFYYSPRVHFTSDNSNDAFPCGIVSNHVSWCDILVHMSISFPSFVAKEDIKELPMVGIISKMMGCIYVSRKINTNKGVSSEIVDRMHETNKLKIKYRNVLLFPEGTTTNGKYLLPFKTGAFVSGLPIQAYILKYSSPFVSPSWETIEGPRHLFLMMASPWHNLKICVLPVYCPNETEKKDPVLYSKNVRKYMLQYGNLMDCQSTFRHKGMYQKILLVKYNIKNKLD